MEIRFTNQQYDSLLKLVYLGNWMINAIRTDDIVQKYEDLEQYIYSFAKQAGLEELIEYDPDLQMFFPTKEFEDNTEIEEYREDYNDEIFWDGLVERLARRDFIRKYGEEVILAMSWEERFQKEYPFIERYETEFEQHGIDRLEIIIKS